MNLLESNIARRLEDPIEIGWIENQQALYVVVLVSILLFLVIREGFQRYYQSIDERVIREGMTYLFKINDE
jgi:hypothetical protein